MRENIYSYYKDGRGHCICILVKEGLDFDHVLHMDWVPRIYRVRKNDRAWIKRNEYPVTKKNNAKRFLKFAKAMWKRGGKRTISNDVKQLLKSV